MTSKQKFDLLWSPILAILEVLIAFAVAGACGAFR